MQIKCYSKLLYIVFIVKWYIKDLQFYTGLRRWLKNFSAIPTTKSYTGLKYELIKTFLGLFD